MYNCCLKKYLIIVHVGYYDKNFVQCLFSILRLDHYAPQCRRRTYNEENLPFDDHSSCAKRSYGRYTVWHGQAVLD